MILAIDPGTEHSAIVGWDGVKVVFVEDVPNPELVEKLAHWGDTKHTKLFMESSYPHLVIEWITGYGIPAGRETFETCRWVGRFEQAYHGQVHLLPRQKVKQHFQAANDKFIRQALIDRLGKQGTKKNPGPLFGVTGHVLAALAVAVAWWDQNAH